MRNNNGANAWAGLVTRRTDQNNYYYVTLGPFGGVELKRIVGGVFATLGTATVPIATGQKYWLRLESMGATHRVYLDDRLLLEARDAMLRAGAAGVITTRISRRITTM